MNREKINQIYHLYQKEEEERYQRLRRGAQGGEILFYLIMGIPTAMVMLLNDRDMMIVVIGFLGLYSSMISILYYNPLLYEKERQKNRILLKKYLYTPVDLDELCLAKVMVFFSKMGKLYVINLGAAALSALIYCDWYLFIHKAIIIGILLVGIGICFLFNLGWQYKRV